LKGTVKSLKQQLQEATENGEQSNASLLTDLNAKIAEMSTDMEELQAAHNLELKNRDQAISSLQNAIEHANKQLQDFHQQATSSKAQAIEELQCKLSMTKQEHGVKENMLISQIDDLKLKLESSEKRAAQQMSSALEKYHVCVVIFISLVSSIRTARKCPSC
jgi:exonuclease VII large subunit